MALDGDTVRVRKELKCHSCNSEIKKNDLELAYEERWDPILRKSHGLPKRVPYLIVYRKGKEKLSKKPDDYDLELVSKINDLPYPEFPVVEIPDMQMMRVGRMKPSNITHLHQFFLKRPFLTLVSFWKRAAQISDPDFRSKALFFVEQSVWGLSVLARYTLGSSISRKSAPNRSCSFYVGIRACRRRLSIESPRCVSTHLSGPHVQDSLEMNLS
ncbi:hypothetical protein Thiowin_03328 [Thiorhodovibrio winogradskyi]|uniref:Uncharacterized protein n=1 Tax=Thiorhodovibrio winogradskyi TaxID=77007 RepID=A0ABZ0SCR6_9GAMM